MTEVLHDSDLENGGPAGRATEPLPGSAGATAVEPVAPVLLVDLLAIPLRHLRWVVAVPTVLAIAVLAVTLASAPSYVARSSFLPDASDNNLARYAGVAAQLGIRVSAGGGDTKPPEFYAMLVRSPVLLRQAATASYDLTSGGTRRSQTLVDVYAPDGPPSGRLGRTMKLMAKQIAVSTNDETGVVSVTTRTRLPEVSVQLNRRLLDLVTTFNLEKRQSRAAAERKFTQGRLVQARAELNTAEGALQYFLDRNRAWQASSGLSFEKARLERRVDLAQQVFVSLAQAFEQARIEEVRNTPVITVVDPPEGSVERAGRGLLGRLVFAFVTGFILAVAAAWLLEAFRRQRAEYPAKFAAASSGLPRPLQGLLLGRRRSAQPLSTGDAGDA